MFHRHSTTLKGTNYIYILTGKKEGWGNRYDLKEQAFKPAVLNRAV